MKKGWTLFITLFTFSTLTLAQTASIKGQLQNAEKAAVEFANVALYNATDSSFVKAALSDEKGIFVFPSLVAGQYYVEASYIGVGKVTKRDIQLTDGQILDLGVLAFGSTAVELETATVRASRVMVEITA